MRENRPFSTGENGRHPLSPAADPAVAESENPAVQPEQAPSLHPVLNQPPAKAQGNQLPPCDHSVLTFGQRPDGRRRLIDCRNAFYVHSLHNALRLSGVAIMRRTCRLRTRAGRAQCYDLCVAGLTRSQGLPRVTDCA
jgi:hypothetical protein